MKLKPHEADILRRLWPTPYRNNGWAVWVPEGRIVEVRQVLPPDDGRRWQRIHDANAWYLIRFDNGEWLGGAESQPIAHRDLYSLAFRSKQLAVGRAFLDLCEAFGHVAVDYRPIDPPHHRHGVWRYEPLGEVVDRIWLHEISAAPLIHWLASIGRVSADGYWQPSVESLIAELKLTGRANEADGWEESHNPFPTTERHFPVDYEPPHG